MSLQIKDRGLRYGYYGNKPVPLREGFIEFTIEDEEGREMVMSCSKNCTMEKLLKNYALRQSIFVYSHQFLSMHPSDFLLAFNGLYVADYEITVEAFGLTNGCVMNSFLAPKTTYGRYWLK